jgi:hypothetical protein
MKNRSRLIAPEFWESESVADLTFLQRLLFIGLITNADDQGRLKDRAALIRAQVFPYDDISLEEISVGLAALSAMRGIHCYTGEDGKNYIQIVKWWKFQHPSYAQPSLFPAPEGWKDGWNYKTKDNQMSTHNWSKSDSDTRGYTVGYTPLNTPQPADPKSVENGQQSKVTESKVKESKHAAQKTARTPNLNQHIAIQTYREAAHQYPKGTWKQKVVDAVGTNAPDVDFWRQVCESYVGLGWNPGNVKGMLEFYERREIPSVNGRKPPVNEPPQPKWHDRPRWEVLQEEALREEAEREQNQQKI